MASLVNVTNVRSHKNGYPGNYTGLYRDVSQYQVELLRLIFFLKVVKECTSVLTHIDNVRFEL